MCKGEDRISMARDGGLIYELEGQRINTRRKLLQVNYMSYPHKKSNGLLYFRPCWLANGYMTDWEMSGNALLGATTLSWGDYCSSHLLSWWTKWGYYCLCFCGVCIQYNVTSIVCNILQLNLHLKGDLVHNITVGLCISIKHWFEVSFVLIVPGA